MLLILFFFLLTLFFIKKVIQFSTKSPAETVSGVVFGMMNLLIKSKGEKTPPKKHEKTFYSQSLIFFIDYKGFCKQNIKLKSSLIIKNDNL